MGGWILFRYTCDDTVLCVVISVVTEVVVLQVTGDVGVCGVAANSDDGRRGALTELARRRNELLPHRRNGGNSDTTGPPEPNELPSLYMHTCKEPTTKYISTSCTHKHKIQSTFTAQ